MRRSDVFMEQLFTMSGWRISCQPIIHCARSG